MSPRTKIILSIGALLIVGYSSWWLLSSPWLTWHLLPGTGTARAVIDTNHTPLWFDTNLTTVSPTTHAGNDWQRVQFAITQRKQLPAALSQLLHTLLVARQPLRPIAIASISLPNLADPLHVTTVKANNVILVRSQPENNAKVANNHLPLPKATSTPDQLELNIPGHALQAIPSSLLDAWNRDLHKRLGFTHTAPDIMRYSAQFEGVHIALTENEISLGVTGASDAFVDTAIEWVQQEDQHRRPSRQAFRLPDGTIGRELIPGQAEEVFATSASGCRAPLPDKTNLWLCQQDASASLGSNQAIAQLQPDTSNLDTWSITLDPNLLGLSTECENATSPLETTLCHINSLSARGNGNQTALSITLK